VNPAMAPDGAGRPAVEILSSERTVKKARVSMPDVRLRDNRSSSTTPGE
jgi:hypothetical protein